MIDPSLIDRPVASCDERLAVARRKVDRWKSASSGVALWSVDFDEVSAAAKQVDAAIRSLEIEWTSRAPSSSHAPTSWTPSAIAALTLLETRLAEYERLLLANVGSIPT